MGIPLLKMEHVNKNFPGVKALDDVSFDLFSGEVHALMGENGAGKSTLMKILCGVYEADSGEIYLNEQKINIDTPHIATDLGIIMIHQEFNLIKEMTISENIFLGNELSHVLLSQKQMEKLSQEAIDKVGLKKSPSTKIKDLSVGERQMVEIAKAISKNAKIIVFDEPSSALTDNETARLFKIINEIKKLDVGVIYISHKMDEIFQISDRITVLRDGNYISTSSAQDTNIDQIIRHMVGRELTSYYPVRKHTRSEEVVLELEDVSSADLLKNINLKLYSGEILGIAGLMGAGRTELAKTIFGAIKINKGNITLEGESLDINSPFDAIYNGIHMVTEDRTNEGLLLNQSVQENIVLPNISNYIRHGILNESLGHKSTVEMIERLGIVTPTPDQLTKYLSGGNQQKVVIGKWLINFPKILILDEPTRGVDVGAKSEIYNIIVDLAERGISIIMISSELPELLGITDRIVVMHEGKITGEYLTDKTNQEEIMYSATGNVQ